VSADSVRDSANRPTHMRLIARHAQWPEDKKPLRVSLIRRCGVPGDDVDALSDTVRRPPIFPTEMAAR